MDARDVDGGTALHHAAYNARTEILNVLIQAGANLDLVDDQRRTPLLVAVSQGDVGVASVLIQAGADPNKINKAGQSAVHLAALTSCELMQVLLEPRRETGVSAADISVIDKYMQSPIHLASAAGKTEIVRKLLANPAARELLDLQDEDQRTALMYASGLGYVDIVKDLIAAGADANVQIKVGYYLRMHARAGACMSTSYVVCVHVHARKRM